MTGRPLSYLTFEEWILFVFDHPVDDSRLEWYWGIDADWWDGPAALTVEYLTRTFENSDRVLGSFSDSQLNEGLWYLVSNSCSDHMFALLDVSVPWVERKRCIRSISRLYEHCFAQRCTPHLSHIDEPGAGPLNAVCYMWWDIIPIFGQPKDPTRKEMDQEILQVLGSALKLESTACQESALHGLGHWQPYYPQQVREIIKAFLQRTPRIREELRTYAMSASSGHVL